MMNFGKYIFTVLYYATLSMYRIRRETRYEATFITFALLNAVYVSVWDLAMDWSLGNPYAKHPLLREVLAFRQVWVYYVAMIVDVIVRFNWIFYAIFANDLQHSAVLSFVISFSEICRRGLWTVFRVENEHCTNVLLFRASRDTPLPYELPKPHDETSDDHHPADTRLDEQQQQRTPTATSTAISQPAQPTDVEQGPEPPTPAGASVRSRRASRAAAGISRVGSIVAAAHAQDFERRKRPELSPRSVVQDNDQALGDTTEEEEDDSEDGDGNDDGDGIADDGVPDEGTYADELPTTQTKISEEHD